jgi:hypothetical protein
MTQLNAFQKGKFFKDILYLFDFKISYDLNLLFIQFVKFLSDGFIVWARSLSILEVRSLFSIYFFSDDALHK